MFTDFKILVRLIPKKLSGTDEVDFYCGSRLMATLRYRIDETVNKPFWFVYHNNKLFCEQCCADFHETRITGLMCVRNLLRESIAKTLHVMDMSDVRVIYRSDRHVWFYCIQGQEEMFADFLDRIRDNGYQYLSIDEMEKLYDEIFSRGVYHSY